MARARCEYVDLGDGVRRRVRVSGEMSPHDKAALLDIIQAVDKGVCIHCLGRPERMDCPACKGSGKFTVSQKKVPL